MPIEDSSKKSKASSGRKKSAPATRKGFNDFEFINLNLSASQKEEVKALDPDTVPLWDWLEHMADKGHKLSIKRDTKSDAYFSTLTGVTSTCENYGLIMTSRAPTLQQSLLVLYFKSEMILDGLAWPAKSAIPDLWS